MDKQVHENEILIPALKIVKANPGINTTKLIDELEKVVDLYPKDKLILAGRNDTYFSQTVRNLCGSHLPTNIFGKCVVAEESGKSKTFTINENGIKLIENNDTEIIQDIVDDENYQKEIDEASVYDVESLKEASNRIPTLKETSNVKRYKTDPKIAKTVLAEKKYICENATLIGENHKTFTTKRGVQYQEGHHLVPVKAQKDFEMNIDRPENIVCLCPICHKAVHNAKKEERIAILKRLYDYKINQLNGAGIYISFEDLYNKYYI